MKFSDLNSLGKRREPFLFITDFKAENLEVILLKDLESSDIDFCIDENFLHKKHDNKLEVQVIDFTQYKKKFEKIIDEIKSGNTYILNLTQATPVKTSLSLKEVYQCANARYKLRYKNEFVCFSPEKFIQIEDTKIHTFPMKGTIDASLPGAKNTILNNAKEMAEHIMVVDLLRNDLSIVAKDVKVEEFRYVESIHAGKKELLQVSSHISGELGEFWHEKIGDVLEAILPAGSISGAPKKSTLSIIEKVEEYERGFFSGVFGVYDGNKLDSGVMIRFLQKNEEGYVYKSGGGITLDSNVNAEYNELLEKIYLP
ncbi:aminodeoxychorismate synthase component I [Sulfurimonas aquatica]|uniref:Aminodeoxychorismate synthase component I n=1 Tax=Sulfurimonas aquatica TaxID=2672570 RepID=A0A975B1G0_9BACT|nr:aminodeoxychorismate synthase component I [Sulfurimonas aquatica]QSZ42462.1 aminodeoxychorismate synthase component I [Sulfurimonas aquatica]